MIDPDVADAVICFFSLMAWMVYLDHPEKVERIRAGGGLPPEDLEDEWPDK